VREKIAIGRGKFVRVFFVAESMLDVTDSMYSTIS
jgi:hypothetical protein